SSMAAHHDRAYFFGHGLNQLDTTWGPTDAGDARLNLVTRAPRSGPLTAKARQCLLSDIPGPAEPHGTAEGTRDNARPCACSIGFISTRQRKLHRKGLQPRARPKG